MPARRFRPAFGRRRTGALAASATPPSPPVARPRRRQARHQDRYRSAGSGADAVDRHPDAERRRARDRRSEQGRLRRRQFKLAGRSARRCRARRARSGGRRAERQDVHRRSHRARDDRAVQLQRREGGDPAHERRGAGADLALEHQRRAHASATTRRSCAPRIPTSTRTSASARTNRGRARALAKFAKQARHKKVFIIDDNETYGKGLADSLRAPYFKADGGTSLGHEHITSNQQDFKALLTKVKASDPDVVFFGGNTSTGGGLLRRQMGDVGMSKHAVHRRRRHQRHREFVRRSRARSRTARTISVAAPDADKLLGARSSSRPTRRGSTPTSARYSANAYAAAEIEIAAIEKAIKENGGKMPTRAEVLKNVAATKDFDTPIGKIGVRRQRRHDARRS